jgi:hypothetical protein
LAARARPCAARTRLFGLIATQSRTLRAHPPCPSQLRCFSCDPPKIYSIKFIELGPPTSKAFFFPLDYMQAEEAMKYEDPFFLFYIVLGSFLFVLFFFFSPFYFLLIYLFLSFSSYLFLFFS